MPIQSTRVDMGGSVSRLVAGRLVTSRKRLSEKKRWDDHFGKFAQDRMAHKESYRY